MENLDQGFVTNYVEVEFTSRTAGVNLERFEQSGAEA